MSPERADLVWPVLLVLGIPAVLSGQCFLFDHQFKAMHRFMLFLFGMRCTVEVPFWRYVSTSFLDPVLGAMMKQVC